MARVVQFPIPSSPVFDPETTAVIVAAYDRACMEVHGQPEMVRELVAKRLIEIASGGERNPERLWRGTLMSLGLPDSPR